MELQRKSKPRQPSNQHLLDKLKANKTKRYTVVEYAEKKKPYIPLAMKLWSGKRSRWHEQLADSGRRIWNGRATVEGGGTWLRRQ